MQSSFRGVFESLKQVFLYCGRQEVLKMIFERNTIFQRGLKYIHMPFAKKIHMHVEFACKTRVKTVRRLRLDFTLRAQLHKDMHLVLKKFRFQQLRDEMEANRIVKEPAYLIIKHLHRKYNRIYQESDTELLTYAFL